MVEVKLSFNLQHANRKNRQKVLIRSLSTPPLDSYIIFLRRWEIRDFSKTKFRDQKGRLDFITLEVEEKLHKLPWLQSIRIKALEQSFCSRITYLYLNYRIQSFLL